MKQGKKPALYYFLPITTFTEITCFPRTRNKPKPVLRIRAHHLSKKLLTNSCDFTQKNSRYRCGAALRIRNPVGGTMRIRILIHLRKNLSELFILGVRSGAVLIDWAPGILIGGIKKLSHTIRIFFLLILNLRFCGTTDLRRENGMIDWDPGFLASVTGTGTPGTGTQDERLFPIHYTLKCLNNGIKLRSRITVGLNQLASTYFNLYASLTHAIESHNLSLNLKCRHVRAIRNRNSSGMILRIRNLKCRTKTVIAPILGHTTQINLFYTMTPYKNRQKLSFSLNCFTDFILRTRILKC